MRDSEADDFDAARGFLFGFVIGLVLLAGSFGAWLLA